MAQSRMLSQNTHDAVQYWLATPHSVAPWHAIADLIPGQRDSYTDWAAA